MQLLFINSCTVFVVFGIRDTSQKYKTIFSGLAVKRKTVNERYLCSDKPCSLSLPWQKKLQFLLSILRQRTANTNNVIQSAAN